MAFIDMKLNKAKSFFDDTKLNKSIERGQVRGLFKLGGAIRRDAKRSMRSKRGTSLPGRPPKKKTGLLRDFIFFFVDKDGKGVIAGPIRVNAKTAGKVPKVHEEGGVIDGKHYPARPYMAPVLKRLTQPAPLQKFFGDSIKP